jgi:hypothetical protein
MSPMDVRMTARSGKCSALLFTMTKGPGLWTAAEFAAGVLLIILETALGGLLYVLAKMTSKLPQHTNAMAIMGQEANRERLRRTIVCKPKPHEMWDRKDVCFIGKRLKRCRQKRDQRE